MRILEKKYNGITEDIRSEKEKAKDWDSREVVMGALKGSKITEEPGWHLDQVQTSACAPHSLLFMLIYNGVVSAADRVSPFPLYRKRFNYARPGSNVSDLIEKINPSTRNVLAGLSTYIEVAHPQTPTEAWANLLPYLIGRKIAKDFEYYTVHDMTDLERIVNSGTAVTLGFCSTSDEWRREYVEERTTITNPYTAAVRHQVTLKPRGAFWEKGKLWFSVLDSAKFGNRFTRYVTLEFLTNRRINFPVFAVPKQVEPTPQPPLIEVKPLVAVRMEDRGQNVENLQAYLAKRGYLDPKHVTGYYGPLTSKAVLWFQLQYHEKMDATIPELLDLKGQWWGPQSIDVVKELKD
jgi:hypothetical protein